MRLLITGIFFLCLTANVAFADYAQGKAAYESKDWFNAIRYLRPLAEQGDDRAMVLLGNMYMDGKGVGKNYETAFTLYKQALTHNNDDAMLAVGTMYAEGLSVKKNFTTAFDWYTKSAEYGNPAAQFLVASVYINGHPRLKNVKADPVKAYTWYKIVAQQEEMPEIAKTADKFAEALIPQLSPEDIIHAEEQADAFQPRSEKPNNKD